MASMTSSNKRQKTNKKSANGVNRLMLAHEQFIDKLESIRNDNTQNSGDKSTTSWKSKSEEIDYKLKCVKTYKELKKEGWRKERIENLFPELKGFSQSDSN